MQIIFVTGAEGFIGRHVLKHLEAAGYEVIAGVRNRARKLAHERNHGRAMVCDVADAINVARVIATVRPDGIIHLASVTNPAVAHEEPLSAYQTTVTGWANLLDAVRRCVPRARVVLTSACDVYGNAGADGSALTEDMPPAPITTIGSWKRIAETVADVFYRDYHLNIAVARPFHCTGPGQSDQFFFGAIARRLAAWNPDGEYDELRVPDLDCQRDVLHVDDVAAAFEHLLCGGRPNKVYNICSGTALTCRELVSAMIAETEHSIRLSDLPTDEAADQVSILRGDNGKMQREFGWTPARTAMEAVQELVRSHSDHLATTAK